MSHNLLYSALLGAASLGILPACTAEADEPAAGQEVRFNASATSRATLVTNATLKNSPFAVWGDFAPANSALAVPEVIFDGTLVKHNGSTWVYDDIQLWTPGSVYSFVAVSPADKLDAAGITYQDNTLSFKYSQPSYKEATDILGATHRRVYSSGKADPVAFYFHHLLSRLNFSVVIDPSIGANTTVTIESLSLTNVGLDATYTTTPAPTTSATDDNINTGWTLDSDPDGTLFTINPGVTLSATERYEFFPADTDPLMVIPQTVHNMVTAVITYHVTTNGNVGETVTSTSRLFNAAQIYHQGRWGAGQSYSYTFTLGVDDMIIFQAPEVKPWQTADGGSYII